MSNGVDLDEAVTNRDNDQETQQSAAPETGAATGGVVEGAGELEKVAHGAAPAPEMAAAVEAAEVTTPGLPELTQLRAIGEASYGAVDALPEAVLGTDERIRITDTESYPWRLHSSLRITAADGSLWVGTAWFIGPRTLITAGHVVFITRSSIAARNGWVQRIEVIPGRDGVDRPFGQAVSTRFFSVRGWTEQFDAEYDYGAIILDEPLGNQTGWIGYGAFSDSSLQAAHANISGYPADKPDGTQWYDNRRVSSVGSRKVFYEIDTAGGQSGSAVYRFIDGQRYAMGIHAYGGATANSATRITSRRFDNLQAWNAFGET